MVALTGVHMRDVDVVVVRGVSVVALRGVHMRDVDVVVVRDMHMRNVHVVAVIDVHGRQPTVPTPVYLLLREVQPQELCLLIAPPRL